MDFETALAAVLHHEGGFSDHPKDPGGATNLGVTHITLAEWLGRPVTKEDVRALTVADVRPIYEERYWNRCRCGDLPPGVDLMVFDSAVNQGPRTAVRFLQKAVGAEMDGIIGPATLAAVRAGDRIDILKEVAVRRAVHYAGLQEVFHLGWYRRLFDVFRLSLAG